MFIITEFAEAEMFLAVHRFPARTVNRTRSRRMSVDNSAPNGRCFPTLFVNQAEMMADIFNIANNCIRFFLRAPRPTFLRRFTGGGRRPGRRRRRRRDGIEERDHETAVSDARRTSH